MVRCIVKPAFAFHVLPRVLIPSTFNSLAAALSYASDHRVSIQSSVNTVGYEKLITNTTLIHDEPGR